MTPSNDVVVFVRRLYLSCSLSCMIIVIAVFLVLVVVVVPSDQSHLL